LLVVPSQLAQCDLDEIPPLIGSFYLLRLLDLSDNKLEELPPDVGNCFSLQTLNVSSNRLKSFPDELGQLAHLRTFLFFSNKITTLPEWVGGLALTELNGYNNRILKLPDSLGQLRDVREMNFAANVVMQLQPQSIAQWTAVTILNLYDCRLLKLCSLDMLENLEELRLFNNNLEEVPEVGYNLHKLKSACSTDASTARTIILRETERADLHGSAVPLTAFARVPCSHLCATVVELNKNRITTMPLTFFAGLPGLERIVLSQNNIDSLPVGINCPKLESMIISQNNLTELPPDLPLWPSLRVLFININQLSRLPETFLQNTKIERINLSRNNKLTGTSKHILNHLRMVADSKSAKGGKYWAVISPQK
jgi:hypothetical protein